MNPYGVLLYRGFLQDITSTALADLGCVFVFLFCFIFHDQCGDSVGSKYEGMTKAVQSGFITSLELCFCWLAQGADSTVRGAGLCALYMWPERVFIQFGWTSMQPVAQFGIWLRHHILVSICNTVLHKETSRTFGWHYSAFFFALLRKLFSKTSTIFPYYNPGQEALDSITSLRVQNVIRACRTHSNLCLTGCVGWSVCFLLGQSPAHLAFTAILNTDQFFATSQRLSRWHFNLLVNLQANAALHYDMHLSFLILLLLKPSFCSGSKS